MEQEKFSFEERINKLNEFIKSSERIVFFGGAGVSTESGIPDFRSKDGLYNQHEMQFEAYKPEYLLSINCLNDEPCVFFNYYRQKLDCRNVKPNITHKVLAELEKEKKLSAIITQNIDGLHQKAGSKNVLEIHGTINHNYCRKCGKSYDEDYIFNNDEIIPTCKCGGTIRPAVTLYGECLTERELKSAMDKLQKSDLLIIAGTSLTVQPAASLIGEYNGENLVLINRDETQYDSYCNLIFRENIGKVFSNIKVDNTLEL